MQEKTEKNSAGVCAGMHWQPPSSFALLSYLLIAVFAVPLADLFNRKHDPILTDIASNGMRIYFVSLFFSGINIVAAAFLSSIDRPKQAFAVSILRGFVLIIPVAWLMSVLFGLTGIWMAVPVTEACVLCAGAHFPKIK